MRENEMAFQYRASANTQRILIVEDDVHAQNILNDLLNYQGFEVKIFEEGSKSLEYLEHSECDLIVLDLMLPDMNGFEVLQVLRKRQPTQETPIIILSALGNEAEKRMNGLQLGASDFMAKPYHPGELLARINNLLHQKLREQNHELAAINTVAKAVTSTLDLHTMLSEVACIGCQALDMTSAYICDLNPEAQTTSVLAEYISNNACDEEKESDLGVVYSLKTDFPGIWSWSQSKEPSYVSQIDDPDLPPSERFEMERYGAKSILAVPFKDSGATIGYIEFWESRYKRAFTQQEILLAEAIANQTALALRKAKLFSELAESEQRYRDLFENATDLIQITNAVGRFKHVNHSWLETIGYSYQEALNLGFEDILREDQLYKMQLINDTLLQEQAIAGIELILVSKSGDEIIVDCNLTAVIENDELVLTRGIFRDVSEQRQMQQQALRLQIEQERSQILKRYVEAISHDFKTPLSIISTSAYLWAKSTNTGHSKHFQQITSQVQNLKILLERTLLLSELEQDQTLKQVDVNQLIQQVVADFSKTFPTRQIALSKLDTTIPLIYANQQFLEKALSEVIENALIYSPQGSQVLITSYVQDMFVFIEVKDYGIGIPSNIQDKIFEPFFRGDEARNLNQQNSGLGLPLAKRVVDLLGGTVEFDSIENQGTTIRIGLPIIED